MKFFELHLELEDKSISVSQLNSPTEEEKQMYGDGFFSYIFNTRSYPTFQPRYSRTFVAPTRGNYRMSYSMDWEDTSSSFWGEPVILSNEHGFTFDGSRPQGETLASSEMERREAQRQRDLANRATRQDRPVQRNEQRRSSYQRLRDFFGGNE